MTSLNEWSHGSSSTFRKPLSFPADKLGFGFRLHHSLQDQTLLRLPYDLMRKNFRNAHFVVEHESKAITKLLKDTATGSLKGKHSSDDVLKNIDAMLAKAKGIKRKLQACSDEEARLYRQLGARIKHVGEVVSMETVDDVRYEQWSRTRLDRLIVDYMLRHGYNESACALADDRGIRDLVDIDTFIHMSRIQESLANRSVTEALAWCHENKKELRKIDVSIQPGVGSVQHENSPLCFQKRGFPILT